MAHSEMRSWETAVRAAIEDSIREMRTVDLLAAGREDIAAYVERICDECDLASHCYQGRDADGDAWSIRLVGGRFAKADR